MVSCPLTTLAGESLRHSADNDGTERCACENIRKANNGWAHIWMICLQFVKLEITYRLLNRQHTCSSKSAIEECKTEMSHINDLR